jgi:adenylate cyclase, class 2
MNEEVEIQVVLKNPEYVEKRLKEIAQFIKAKNQKDEYFIPKHEDFFELAIPVEYLRVRHEDGKNELNYNFLHLNADGSLLKTDEYEVKVGNPEMMSLILKKLDMENKVTVTKHRKTFQYKDFEVLLDYIEELGYFLEIEAKKHFGSIEETKKKCYELLGEIGAEWEEMPIGLRGYPIMILAKRDGRL